MDAHAGPNQSTDVGVWWVHDRAFVAFDHPTQTVVVAVELFVKAVLCVSGVVHRVVMQQDSSGAVWHEHFDGVWVGNGRRAIPTRNRTLFDHDEWSPMGAVVKATAQYQIVLLPVVAAGRDAVFAERQEDVGRGFDNRRDAVTFGIVQSRVKDWG